MAVNVDDDLLGDVLGVLSCFVVDMGLCHDCDAKDRFMIPPCAK